MRNHDWQELALWSVGAATARSVCGIFISGHSWSRMMGVSRLTIPIRLFVTMGSVKSWLKSGRPSRDIHSGCWTFALIKGGSSVGKPLNHFFDVEYLPSVVQKMRLFVFGIGIHWNCIVYCEVTKAQSMLLGFRMVVW